MRDNNYMNSNIENICGISEITPDFESIASNPNFVFQPDENYTAVVLYNSEGSIINVNSWLEWANYVNGGWFSNITDLINYEKRLFYSLLFIGVIATFIQFSKQYRGQKNSKI